MQQRQQTQLGVEEMDQATAMGGMDGVHMKWLTPGRFLLCGLGEIMCF
jgi:hypothetical protein